MSAQSLIGRREIVAVCAPSLAANITNPRQLLAQPLMYHSNCPDNWKLWADAVGAEMPARPQRTGSDLLMNLMNLIEAARAGLAWPWCSAAWRRPT